MIDYMIVEAVALKNAKEEEKAAKSRKQQEWKKDKSGLDKLREAAG